MKSRLALVLILFLAPAAPVQTAPLKLDTKPYIALVVSQSADTWSTLYAFDRGCVEGNSFFYGERPSATRLIATKAAGTAAIALLMRTLEHRGRAGRIASKVLAYGVSSGVSTYAVVNNLRCGR